ESLDLKGGTHTLILPGSADRFAPVQPGGSVLTDFCWLADGRILYPVWEPEHQRDENLWEIKVDARIGRPQGAPRRITNWSGFSFDNFSLSADGRRLAFQKSVYRADVYIARSRAG